MSPKLGLVSLALWFGCSGAEDAADATTQKDATSSSDATSASDATASDAFEGDAAIDGGVDPSDAAVEEGFEHCPPASAWVGDQTWDGVLTTGSALLCAYPAQNETADEALARKQRLKLVGGDFAFPTSAAGAAFRIPACIEQTTPDVPPAILEGTVSAEQRGDWDDPTERYYVDASFPLDDGSGFANLFLRADLDDPTVSLVDPLDNIFSIQMYICSTAACDQPGNRTLFPCRLASNICDEFDFAGGSLAIDQFHWAGQVGAGFAAGVRIRGTLDGTDFVIDDYRNLTITFGHHAFTRGVIAFFDAPIGGVCGFTIEEIAEFSQSDVHLIDRDRRPIETRTVTAQNHLWGMPCP